MLQESLRTPIALDQSITGAAGWSKRSIWSVVARCVSIRSGSAASRPRWRWPKPAARQVPRSNVSSGVNQQTSIGLHASLALAAAGICAGPVDFVPLDPACGDLAGCFMPVRNAAGGAEISAAEIALPSPAPSRRLARAISDGSGDVGLKQTAPVGIPRRLPDSAFRQSEPAVCPAERRTDRLRSPLPETDNCLARRHSPLQSRQLQIATRSADVESSFDIAPSVADAGTSPDLLTHRPAGHQGAVTAPTARRS